MAFEYCRCLCFSVCACVCAPTRSLSLPLQIRITTFGSEVQNAFVKILVVLGAVDLDLQGRSDVIMPLLYVIYPLGCHNVIMGWGSCREMSVQQEICKGKSTGFRKWGFIEEMWMTGKFRRDTRRTRATVQLIASPQIRAQNICYYKVLGSIWDYITHENTQASCHGWLRVGYVQPVILTSSCRTAPSPLFVL